MKIAVYAISKNEEQFVKRFCESAKDADVIQIVDTGSTDNTIAEAKKHGAVVHSISINPWRFDAARNASLALLPADVDVCISLDLDEVLLPGWRKIIEDAWVGETNRLQHLFDNGDGLIFGVSRIHARNGFVWKYPCHEYVITDARNIEKLAVIKDVLMLHQPDPTKSRGQYMPMLEMATKEDPNCSRSQFYLARELLFHKRHEDAIKEFKKYLAMPNATWFVERSYSMRAIGSCEELLGRDGTQWFYRSLAEDPMAREPWLELANKAYRKEDWQKCYLNAKMALLLDEKALWHTTDPKCWTWPPHDFAAISAHYLGLKEESIKQGEEALKFDPTNERLIKNLEFYRK
jgi:glycosyltransferase involved in cell wall biosynthesis